MKKLLLLGILLCQTGFIFAQNKEKVVASDLTRIKQLGNVALSPDGNSFFMNG